MAYVIFASIPILLWKIFKNKKYYFICVYAIFGIISGIRGEDVGFDTFAYNRMYSACKDISFSHIFENFPGRPEPGTWLIIQISSIIYDDPQMYIFISSFLTYVFLGVFIYKNIDKRYGWLATFLIVAVDFFFFQLNVMRQALATAIICNAYQYAVRSKYKEVICISVIATMFHYAVLCVLPTLLIICYFLKRGIARHSIVKLVGIACFATIGIVYASNMVIHNSDFLPYMFRDYILVTSKYNAAVEGGTYRVLQIAMFGSMAFFCTLCAKEELRIKQIIAIDMLILEGTIFVILSSFVIGIFHRLIGIFFIYSCLLIPYFLTYINNKELKYFIEVCIILFGMVHVIFNVDANIQGVVPYETFFEDYL